MIRIAGPLVTWYFPVPFNLNGSVLTDSSLAGTGPTLTLKMRSRGFLTPNGWSNNVTKGAVVGKLFGGEYGIQFLGAKFWKSWQDLDLADNVMPYGLPRDNYEDAYTSTI